MDLFLNWCTAKVLHSVNWLRKAQHEWEHRITLGDSFEDILLLLSLYGLWATASGPVLYFIDDGMRDALEHGRIIYFLGFVYTGIHNGTRLSVRWYHAYHPEAKRLLYHNSVLSKFATNYSNYYWAHFTFHPWDRTVSLGNAVPFYDVLFGTSAFDIPFSVPIPYIDFIFQPICTFKSPTLPDKIKSTTAQRLHRTVCFVGVFSMAFAGKWQWGAFTRQ